MILGDQMRAAETRGVFEGLASDFGLEGHDDQGGAMRRRLGDAVGGPDDRLEDADFVIDLLDAAAEALRGWEHWLNESLAADCVDLRDKALRVAGRPPESGPLDEFRRPPLSGPEDFSDAGRVLHAVMTAISSGASVEDDLYYDLDACFEEFPLCDIGLPGQAAAVLDKAISEFHSWEDHPDLLAAAERTRDAARRAASSRPAQRRQRDDVADLAEAMGAEFIDINGDPQYE